MNEIDSIVQNKIESSQDGLLNADRYAEISNECQSSYVERTERALIAAGSYGLAFSLISKPQIYIPIAIVAGVDRAMSNDAEKSCQLKKIERELGIKKENK